jgi:hypothetical protein
MIDISVLRQELKEVAPRVFGGSSLDAFVNRIDAATNVAALRALAAEMVTARRRNSGAARRERSATDTSARAQALRASVDEIDGRFAAAITLAQEICALGRQRLCNTLDQMLSEHAFHRRIERRLAFMNGPERSAGELEAVLADVVCATDAQIVEAVQEQAASLRLDMHDVAGDLPLIGSLPLLPTSAMPSLAEHLDLRIDGNILLRVYSMVGAACFGGSVAKMVFKVGPGPVAAAGMAAGAVLMNMVFRRNLAKEAVFTYRGALPPAAETVKRALRACLEARYDGYAAETTELFEASRAAALDDRRRRCAVLEVAAVEAQARAALQAKLTAGVDAAVRTLERRLAIAAADVEV